MHLPAFRNTGFPVKKKAQELLQEEVIREICSSENSLGHLYLFKWDALRKMIIKTLPPHSAGGGDS